MIESGRRGWIAGMIPAVVLAAAGALPAPAGAVEDELNEKLMRQVNVMEKILDEVLVDSPNLLVYSSHPTHGLYLDEFGVVFVFEASLVDKGGDWRKGLSFLKDFRIESEDGKIIIYKPGAEDEDEESGDDTEETLKSWREKKEERDAELYGKGKEELMDALVGYGDTLTRLRDDQWVAIAAFLKDSDYFLTNEISQLVLKARVRDLQAYASEKISKDDLVARVVVEER